MMITTLQLMKPYRRKDDAEVSAIPFNFGDDEVDFTQSITVSDFLFAQPSFWSGMARLLDVFGLFDSYNESSGPEEADAIAMYVDWRITGEDICRAANTFESELSEVQSRQLPLNFAK